MTIRTLMLGATLSISLVALGARIEATPNEATIPLDDVAAVWVKQHDDSWISYINGAPDIVNESFFERYAPHLLATPTPEPAPDLSDFGRWTIDGTSASLIEEPKTRFYPAHDPFKLTIECEPTFDVVLSFDSGRRVEAGAMARGTAIGSHLPVYIEVDGESWKEPGEWNIYEFWEMPPGYTKAYAPDPAVVVEHLRGGGQMYIVAREAVGRLGTPIGGEADLRGIAAVLAALPCVE